MWVDDEGVYHTVALPDPALLMTDAFRESLNGLLATSHEEVAMAIEAEELRFYAADSHPQSDEAVFVGAVPPEVLIEPVATVDDLTALLRSIDRRWRLDVLAALDEHFL